MACSKTNFSGNEIELTSLKFVQELESSDIDVLAELIISTLQGAPFSVDINLSDNPDKYEKSIEELITSIQDIIKLNNKLKFILTKERLATLQRKLTERLMPPRKTVLDKKIEAVIPSVGMLSEEKVRLLQFKDILAKIFGENLIIRTQGEREFRKDLLTLAIIDLEHKTIIEGDKDLNERLTQFKRDEYLKIVHFIETIKGDNNLTFQTSDYALSYYIDQINKKSNVINAYSIMYNYINRLENEGRLESAVKDGWLAHINSEDNSNAKFFEALNAYITLQFFDLRIKSAFGKYIKINRNYDEPISIDKDTNETIYKYSLIDINQNMVKGWETAEFLNAIDLMSGFAQILIESIPYLDYRTKKRGSIARFQNLNAVLFNNAFVSLREAIMNLKVLNLSLEKLIDSTFDYPQNWFTVLQTIFDNDSIKTALLAAQNLNGKQCLNEFDLNVLYSVYHQVFAKPNGLSYNSIELNHMKIVGVTDRVPIVSTLLGLINATSGMNYLELVWDKNAEVPKYVLRVKRKFNSVSTSWDMIKAVNRHTWGRTDKGTVLAQHNLRTFNNEKIATLNVARAGEESSEITITFGTHILDKNSSIKFKELKGVWSERGTIDKNLLASAKDILRLLVSPTKEEKVLLATLAFVDLMLLTTFSMDEDGLTEFKEYLEQGGKFSSLVAAAIRALKICEIYNKLEQNPNYQKTQVLQYLKDNPDVYQVNIQTRESGKGFYTTTKKGVVLSTLGYLTWLDLLITARMIINGSTSRAVTKNAEGSYIPNYSPTFTGDKLLSYLAEANEEKTSSSYLLFAGKKRAIKSVVLDTDIRLKNETIKSIKKMSETELFQHAIVDKFHLPLSSQRRTAVILPTTYSDKTKYINYEISLSDLGINIYSSDISKQCTTLLYNTVGKYYQEIWKAVLNNYEQIFGTRDVALIEQELNKHNELSFVALAQRKGVTVYKDLHYRLGKKLSINELLWHYATDLYASMDSLERRLNVERKLFINDLIRTRTNFYITRDYQGEITYLDPVGYFFSQRPSSDLSKWIKGNRLILAKVTDASGHKRDVEFGLLDINVNETIELNPFLESYFSSDVLISNNLRFSITGSEINHMIKGSTDVLATLGEKVFEEFGFDENITMVSAALTLKLISDNTAETKKRRNAAKKAYNILKDDLFYSREAGGLGAQLKRNVAATATMRPYLLDLIDGTPSVMRCAIIDDIQVPVLNFDGSSCYKKGKYGSGTIDAHNGYAHINPIMSILENKSLQDNKIGDMKKNILHGYDNKTGCATLLKYAAGAITNSLMRDSELSPVSLRRLFKKMSNERWSERSADGTIKWIFTDDGKESGIVDLLRCDYKSARFRTLNFTRDILLNKRLFYEDRGTLKEILKFGRDGLDYYTIEQDVLSNGNAASGTNTVKVYHYFDRYGNHITKTTPEYNTTPPLTEKFEEQINLETGLKEMVEVYHTIDSLYELWTAMGGLGSRELVNGTLEESEASLYATTGFVNFVANKKEGVPDNAELTQRNYDQPLKRAFIGYLVNNTAIKNGAGNLNPVSSYYDDTPFRTIKIKVKGHGVQQDSDHEADEAIMTEFSQVITSLDAGGRMHNYVKQIYSCLGRVALQLAGIEIEAVKAFKETGNKSKIYDLLGRTIMKNIKEGQRGLLKAIMTEILKEFNVNSDHDQNIFKIPFDDPNIYHLILSTFVSIINRKSIKRQYPGSGMVMMPGYDIETVFDFNGETYQYNDLVKLTRTLLSPEEKSSIQASNNADYDRLLVRKLLEKEQTKWAIEERVDWVQPADRVNVYINDIFAKDILINTTDDFYRFKGIDLRKLLAEKIYGVKISKEYDKPLKARPDNLNPDGTVKTNKAFQITLEGVDGYFEIVKDFESNYWSIYFETGVQDEQGNVLPNPNFTEELKLKLFSAAALVIPEGDFLSGVITADGIAGLNRFRNLGFNVVGERTIVDVDNKPINIPILLSNLHLKFLKNVTKPRNLAPVKIEFELPNGTKMSIFDHWSIKGLYTTNKRNKVAIQRAFDALNKGIYENGYIDAETGEAYYYVERVNDLGQFLGYTKTNADTGRVIEFDGNIDPETGLKVDFGVIKLDKSKIINKEAECIVPNIFQSKFGLSSNQSLIDILTDSRAFVYKTRPVTSENYDLVFTKNNNRHTYITFKPVNSNSNTYETSIIPWTDTVVEDMKDQSTGVILRVYAVDSNNIKMFEIARKRVISTVIKNPESGKFTDLNGNVLEDLDRYTTYNDLVLETITFVQKRSVQEETQKLTNRYTLYNINVEAFREVYVPDGKHSAEDFIGVILSDIYNNDDYLGVQLNTTMTVDSANVLRKSLNSFANRLKHNKALYTLIMGDSTTQGLYHFVQAALNESLQKLEKYKINRVNQLGLLNKYFKELSKEVRASFLRSLYFTSSRIPSLSHLSFMQMRAVAFTRGDVTHTFVSHFLTWLLGSKEINKN